ncbi:hypothetical protein [Streptococcus ruminantium]|uniref:hypothetical protein n=1 Tax=Streptococcus ruminantium TaxID=1917441 RepID=UPI0012DFE5B1|nr:hypothetical protein [Streptococcus ruminantium]
MELVLPNNYVALEEEEMMYLDGGDWNNFRRNIEGLSKRSEGLRFAMREVGLLSSAGKAVWANKTILLAKVGMLSGKVIVVVGLLGVGIVGAVGLTLYNVRLFY